MRVIGFTLRTYRDDIQANPGVTNLVVCEILCFGTGDMYE